MRYFFKLTSFKRELALYKFSNATRGGIGTVFEGFIFPMYIILEFEIKNNELTLGTTAYLESNEFKIDSINKNNELLAGSKFRRE